MVARLLEESEREVVKLVPKPVEVVDTQAHAAAVALGRPHLFGEEFHRNGETL